MLLLGPISAKRTYKFARVEMHVATMLSIVGSAVAMVGFSWQKRWLPSLIFAFSLSYTIFDKVFPASYLSIG